MTQQQKKDLMAKVTVEINAADVMQLGREIGMPVTLSEAAELLSNETRARCMWQHMVDAGRDYIAASLEARRRRAWWETAAGHDEPQKEGFDA